MKSPKSARPPRRSGISPIPIRSLEWNDPHMPRTVLIVDDHAAFRRSARRLLEAEGFQVVGEAADGTDALAKARELRPELVLLDVLLPDVDGFAVAELLAQELYRPVVVLTSSREASDYVRRLADT